MLLFYILYWGSAIYYQKNVNISNVLSIGLSVTINTLGYVLHPCALNAAGRILGVAISGEAGSNMISYIVVSIIGLIISVVYIWFVRKILSNTIMFRPDSIQTLSAYTHFIQYLIPQYLALICGLASTSFFYLKIALYFLALASYIFAFIFFLRSVHTVKAHTISLIAVSMAGMVNVTLVIVLQFVKLPDSLIIVVIFAVIFVISYIISSEIQKRSTYRDLNALDEFEETRELSVKNTAQFEHYVMTGFQLSHPVCIDFTIFEEGIRQLPDDITVLMIYAKFVAIFPEVNKTLALIQQQLMSSGMRNGMAKQIIHQIISIIDTRENVLNPSLKKKLNTAQKKVNSAKRKLLSIWDFVIQSNIGELDGAIEGAFQAGNAAEREVNRLVAAYPNNVFVSRIYQRYLKEIRFDMKKTAEQLEKVRLLRRGMLASVDRAHELGTHAFPNLPVSLENASSADKANIISMESFQNDSDVFDDELAANSEILSNLRTQIENVTIPSVTRTVLFAVLATAFSIILPIILLIALDNMYIANISEPVDYIDELSMMRYMTFVVAANILRISTEELKFDDGSPVGMSTDSDDFYQIGYIPTNIGNTRDIRGQFKGLVPQIAAATGQINNMRDYKPKDPNMDIIRSYIFEASTPYQYYKTATQFETINMSIISCLMDSSMQASNINQATVTKETLNRPEFLNPGHNCENVGNAISNVLTLFIEEIRKENSNMQFILMIIEVVYSVILAFIFFGMIVFIMKSTNGEAREVYKALTMLPKGVVSQAAEAQRQIKKGSDSTTNGTTMEMNKQEENIIKVFASAADSSSGYLPMHLVQITSICILLAVGIAGIIIMMELYKSQYKGLIVSAPHADYLLGMCGYMYGSLVALHTIALYNDGFTQTTNNISLQVDRFDSRLDTFVNYFNKLRYGGSASDEFPFTGFAKGLEIAKTYLPCSDEKRVEPHQTFPEIIRCYNAEYHITLFSSMARRLIEPYRIFPKEDFGDPGDPPEKYELRGKNTWLGNLWVLGPCLIYDTFVYPVHQTLIGEIKAELIADLDTSMQSAIICMCVAAICVIIVIYEVVEIGKRIKFTMTLFLQVDPKVVMSTAKIMQLVNGNFSKSSQETSTRNSAFFEEVVDKLINAVILCNGEGNIISMNAACKKAFDVQVEDFLGKHASAFFTKERFGPNVDAEACMRNQSTAVQSGNEFYECQATATKDYIIISLNNNTARVIHSRLIAEERAKSDHMLSSILPPAMVPRVQAGETNISFAVQSASVLFLDIVSFTPWCGSNQATYTMKVLNRMFKDLDARMKEYPTLTKIKCIGDCYMAAGGIFSEVNQPAVHAREMVQFGLDAIAVLENMDKDLNEKLQIRVGINTGGPLVAGVIGTGKPTFEILGPCINMAQQMEHHGVPMKVHISRSTYELIYGMNFNIKERGEVEVKQGKVTTYVVTP